MIVTLAGHVDHGKTSLVKALTGVDTDVLEDERKRGLTIDLGFAYLRRNGSPSRRNDSHPRRNDSHPRRNGDVLGFIDVPGHHRFIHNMVAGVAAMQFALLAVSADDGPMPQTREHLQILQLTGIARGLVALTKCDRASAERMEQAEAELRALLQGTFLQNAPLIRTSASTGAGIAELKQTLWTAAGASPSAQTQGQFRLAVDRAFNIQGTGLVATGTVHSGTVRQGDEVRIFPGNQTARVRGLRAQEAVVDSAAVGDRAAINLGGVGLDEVRRGCWLTAIPMPSRRNFAVDLRLLDDLPRPVRHWLPVHIYHATSHSTGRLALLDAGKALPGERRTVEVVTDEPLCARHGDHLVLRDHGLDRTLGGGRLLTDLPPAARRRDPARLGLIKAFKANDRSRIIAGLLARGPLDVGQLRNTLGLTDEELKEALDGFQLRMHDGEALRQALWSDWRRIVLDFAAQYQREHPAAPGFVPNRLPSGIPERFQAPLLSELLSEKRLRLTAGAYHLPAHVAELPPQQKALLNRVRPHLDQDQAPSLGDLAKALHTPLTPLESGMNGLAQRGLLVRISPKRFYLPERLTAIAAQVATLAKQEPLTVRRFRDHTGIGRNIAIELLEHFDRRGYTRRQGDARMVVGELQLR
ncbi:MAG: selenocysteine-specific translation elongation factor [Gammaproteobacteria bacterium]|nr:selenocysteine-specific translation elongation factor [Gammaproteobacteria bacterium]